MDVTERWRKPGRSLAVVGLLIAALGMIAALGTSGCGDDGTRSDAGPDAAGPDAAGTDAAADASRDAGPRPDAGMDASPDGSLADASADSSTGPRVVRTIPSAGADGVVTDIVVEVEFSESMDRASTEGAFALLADDSPVGGSFAWESGDLVLRFSPDAELSASTDHRLTIGAGATGRDSGLALVALDMAFRTGEGPGGEPSSNWDEMVWDVDVWQ